MTKEERFTSVTIYLAKVVDHLQGRDNGSTELVFPRSSGTVHIDKTVVEIAAGLRKSKESK